MYIYVYNILNWNYHNPNFCNKKIENSNPAFSVCVKVPQEQEYVFKICICNLKIAQKDLDEKK